MTDRFHIKAAGALHPAAPLYERIPKRGQGGARLNDLLMIFPGIKTRPVLQQQNLIRKIETLLRPYAQVIVLAELNLKLGTLWLSIEPGPGLGAEIAAWLHHHIPESRLVAQHSATAPA
ncbi:MAG: hypothetical protein R6X06_03120 [Gammaproteobacteria bacterium]